MITTDKDIVRAEQQPLLLALQSAGCIVITPTRIKCGFHDDQHPSAGLVRGDDGAWRYKCHGCGVSGDVFDIRDRAAGLPAGASLKQVATTTQPARPERTWATLADLAGNLVDATTYSYTHPTTKAVEMAVVRHVRDGRKAFIQAHQIPGGGWVMKAPLKPWPLYNRTRLLMAESVVVVEGEKCVHALTDCGIVATTSPGGAKNANSADWSPLAGKTVYLWPDNDANGREYMADVERTLLTLSPPVTVYRIDPGALGLNEKGDVADFLDANGGTKDDRATAIKLVLDEAKPTGAARDLEDRIDLIASGKWRAIHWGFESLTWATRALLPGTITVICGDPGSGKSFFLQQCAIFWQARGVPMAYFHLEEDKTYHLHRALAQVAFNGDITDDEWIRAHPDEARATAATHRATIDALGKCIWDAPDKQVTLDDLSAWVGERVASGCRVVCIDPVTAAESSHKPWLDDQRFILNTKAALRKHGASLVVVTHPRSSKGSKESPLDSLAGGRAWSRFTQCVVWIKSPAKVETVSVRTAVGGLDVQANRYASVIKSRNGPGSGADIAYWFDGDKLTFIEQGRVQE